MAGVMPLIQTEILDSAPRNKDHGRSVSPQTHDDDESFLLTCTICQNLINDPKQLQCLHTFCKACIRSTTRIFKGHNGDDVIECPTCRLTTKSTSLDKLPNNIVITKLKEEKLLRDWVRRVRKDELLCTNCTSTPRTAVARCVTCNDFMCGECVETHRKIRALKQHLVIALDESYSAIRGVPQPNICLIHRGEVLRFYCQTCGVNICRDCTVVEHPRPEHRHVDIEESIQQHDRNIQKLMIRSAQLEADIKIKIDENHNVSERVKRAVQNSKVHVDEFANKITSSFAECIDKCRHEIYSRLDELETIRSGEIQNNLSGLERVKCRLDFVMEMSRQSKKISLPCNGDTVFAYAQVSSALSDLCNETLVQTDEGLATIAFQPAEEPAFTLSDIGKVLDSKDEQSRKVSASRRKLSLSSLLGDFNDEDDLESIASGIPWKKNLVLTRTLSKDDDSIISSPDELSTNEKEVADELIPRDLFQAKETLQHIEGDKKNPITPNETLYDPEMTRPLLNDESVRSHQVSKYVPKRPPRSRDEESSSTCIISGSFKSDMDSMKHAVSTESLQAYLASQSATYDADLSSNASSSTPKSKWILERSFGHNSNKETSCAWNVVVNTSDDIIVTNERSLGMSVFGRDGRYKRSLPIKLKSRDVLIIDNKYYVTSRTKFVRVYNREGKYLRQFHAVARTSLSNLLYTVYSIALDKATGLLVLGANYSRNSCLSVHRTNGQHVSSVKIAIQPTFIAVTSQSIFVVSSQPDRLVQLVDPTNGRVLVNFDPPERLQWLPSGISCSKSNEIYVANKSSDENRGVYRFSTAGELIDCVTTVVASPLGLTLTDDDKQMIVADYHSVKIFRLKYD